jgi:hypothetical protein
LKRPAYAWSRREIDASFSGQVDPVTKLGGEVTMPVDDAAALRKRHNEGFEAAEREIHNRAIKEALGSICWGLSALSIGGGLWLSSYRDRLPDIAIMGVGLALALQGFLSLRAHRTGTERAHRHLTTFNLIILGIGVFIGAVLAAMLISMSIVLPLGINDRFLYVIDAVVLVAIWGLVTISYFWRRAWNPTEPAPAFFGHVGWSVGIAFFGSPVRLCVNRHCAQNERGCHR